MACPEIYFDNYMFNTIHKARKVTARLEEYFVSIYDPQRLFLHALARRFGL